VATDSDNVRVGVTGAIYVAPAGTALPTSTAGSLNAAFEELGFVDENGVVETQNETTQNIKAWQNSAVVRKILTEHDLTHAFTCLETNGTVLEAYYGNYTDGAEGSVQITGEQSTSQSWVIDVIDGTDEIRIVIPSGQVTTRGAVTYSSQDAIKYPLTITDYPDGSDVKAYVYYATHGAS
jgi:hypothetical protein